jgi:hypothetical protein
MRVMNIGTANDRTASRATVYPVDNNTSTALIQPISADTNGNFFFFADTGDYDLSIRNSGNTTDLYLLPDITLNAIIISSGTPKIVSIQDVAADFAIGGTTIAAAAFYFDESLELQYIGGSSKPYLQLDGAAGKITLGTSAGDPQVVFDNSTSTTATLTTSHTAAVTLTLPATTTTLAGLAVVETFTVAQTFTGGVTLSTTATTVSSAVQSSSTGYFQSGLNVGTTDTPAGGDLTIKRVKANRGTALALGQFTLSAGWGSTASVAVDTNSTDQRYSFVVTNNGTGITAGPNTITINVTADGTWTNAPFAMAWRSSTGTAPAPASGTQITWTTTATTVVISYTFTSAPSAGNTSGYTVFVWG